MPEVEITDSLIKPKSKDMKIAIKNILIAQKYFLAPEYDSIFTFWYFFTK